ncbi:MAG: hypothetical protein ACLFUA_10915, partial [Spirochaetales bacterium]
TILLDTRGLEPSAERLLEIVRSSLSCATCRVVFDWGDRFPWRLDDGTTGRDVFPEQLVAEAGALVARAGSELALRLRTALPEGFSSRSCYRHLDRARRTSTSEWRRALAKTVSDLMDDLVSLLPALSCVEIPHDSGDGEVVRSAALAAGLEVCGFRVPDHDGREGLLGGIEERLARTGHPASLGSAIPALHDRLAAWRTTGWELVASLHEEVVAAASDPAKRGERLVSSKRELSRHLRGLRGVRSELALAYDGVAAAGAIDRFVARLAAPLREQHDALAARVSTIRRSR